MENRKIVPDAVRASMAMLLIVCQMAPVMKCLKCEIDKLPAWLGLLIVLTPSLFRSIREMDETDGTLYLSHTPSCRRKPMIEMYYYSDTCMSRSRISHANIPGSRDFNSRI